MQIVHFRARRCRKLVRVLTVVHRSVSIVICQCDQSAPELNSCFCSPSMFGQFYSAAPPPPSPPPPVALVFRAQIHFGLHLALLFSGSHFPCFPLIYLPNVISPCRSFPPPPSVLSSPPCPSVLTLLSSCYMRPHRGSSHSSCSPRASTGGRRESP